MKKPFILAGFFFMVLSGMVAAGEITLSVKHAQAMMYSCSLTNGTGQQVYVFPIYMLEEFYAQPNCSDCATGWIASAPMPIGDAKDYIPLAAGGAIQFKAMGRYGHPLRFTCMAVTNAAHVTDKTTSDKKSSIVIRSAEISGEKFPQPQQKP